MMALEFAIGDWGSSLPATRGGPQWLIDTMPSSSYNGSLADVDVLVGGFEFLGLSLSVGCAALYVAASWFLYQSRVPSTETHRGAGWLFSQLVSLAMAVLCVADRILVRSRVAVKGANRMVRTEGLRQTVGFISSNETTAGSPSYPYDEPHGLRHLAVIMDGNRRYGKLLAKQTTEAASVGDVNTTAHRSDDVQPTDNNDRHKNYGGTDVLRIMATSPLNGHRAGGEKLMEVIDLCVKHHIEMLTVYAFSTENWSRSQEEINVLMYLFEHFFQRIRHSARTSGIFIRFVSTEPQLLPPNILRLMETVEEETRAIQPRRIVVNVCVSYGGRSEIVRACQRLVRMDASQTEPSMRSQEGCITENALQREMLRSVTQSRFELEDKNVLEAHGGVEPQVLLRTSGEARISNFLMFETAYSELVFVEKSWPEVNEGDIVAVIEEYCHRQRRFGK
jgi:undecaprenyl diphosphate synthase